jgi:hypothetical protein
MAAPDIDFLTALGEEFCEALSPSVPDDLIVPNDGYEIWQRTFGTDPNPVQLQNLSMSQLEQLRSICAEYFECPEISTEAIQLAVSRTLARWPSIVE